LTLIGLGVGSLAAWEGLGCARTGLLATVGFFTMSAHDLILIFGVAFLPRMALEKLGN